MAPLRRRTQPSSPTVADARTDDGIAIVLTLLLMLAASVVGGSLMLLSQSETFSSFNYRLMTQARYGAESGVHKAVNHLLNGYTPPSAASLPGTFTATVSPVLYAGNPVVLSARGSVEPNYPDAAQQATFFNAARGTIMAGNTPVEYAASATLLSTRAINDYGASTQTVLQTWRIDAEGTVAGSRPATVEVSAILERHVIMVSMFGLFATGQTCSALHFSGGVSTDSYDSSNMTFGAGGQPVTQPTGGNVGSNGNLTMGGTGSTINGSLSTPRIGAGNCTTTGAGLTLNGGSTVSEGMDQMPQPIVFPPPAVPTPTPPTSNFNMNKNTTCSDLGLAAPYCTGVNGNPSTGGLTLNPSGSPLGFGNLNIGAGAQINLSAGNYNFNSISLAGGSSVNVVATTAPVVFNVAGTGVTTPIDFSGGTVSNPTYKPHLLQIQYAGTRTIKVSGGSATALMVYAPEAEAQLVGGAAFYGSILTRTIDVSGGTTVHYDRHSPLDFGTAGNFMLSSFTWKKN